MPITISEENNRDNINRARFSSKRFANGTILFEVSADIDISTPEKMQEGLETYWHLVDVAKKQEEERNKKEVNEA